MNELDYIEMGEKVDSIGSNLIDIVETYDIQLSERTIKLCDKLDQMNGTYTREYVETKSKYVESLFEDVMNGIRKG